MGVGLSEFLHSLGSVEQDAVTDLFSSLIHWANDERLSRIDEQLDQVKATIDRVNRKREHLMSDIETVDNAIARLERIDDPELDLVLLADHLRSLALELRSQIDRMRPEAELKRKHELKVQRDRLLSGRQIAELALEAMKVEAPSGPAQS